MATIASLFVELKLMADNFNNGLKTAQKEAKEFEKTVKPTQKMLDDVGGAMTGAGLAISGIGVPFAMAAKSAIDTAEAFYDMAQRTGASTEALSAVSFAALEAGASAGAVEMAFKKSSKVLEDASTGSKAAAESLSKIGLSVDDLMKMKPDDRFFAMAKGLDSIKDAGARSAISQELFGKSGTELIPILGDLAKGQAAVVETANQFGQVVTGKAAKSANDFNDAASRLMKSLGGVFIAMVDSGLIDTLSTFANRMAILIGEFTKAHPNIVAVAAVLGTVAAVVGPLVAGIGLMASGIAGLIPLGTSLLALVGGTAGLSAAFSAVAAVVTGPVGIVVAIVAATAALSKFVMNNETMIKLLDPIWNAIGALINKTIDFIIAMWDKMWTFIIEAPKRAKDAILGSVRGITDGVTGFFAGMYDKVVGNSYVPDMLDRIQEEFGRLPGVMEMPALKATQNTISSFANMFETVASEGESFSSKMGSIFGRLSGMGGGLGDLGGALSMGWGLGTDIANAWKSTQAHWQADDWVQNFQNPFDRAMATASPERKSRLMAEYREDMDRFARQGSKHATVIRQAEDTLNQRYGSVGTGGNMGTPGDPNSFGLATPEQHRTLNVYITTLATDATQAARIIAEELNRLGPDGGVLQPIYGR
jgi:hypothetical protein